MVENKMTRVADVNSTLVLYSMTSRLERYGSWNYIPRAIVFGVNYPSVREFIGNNDVTRRHSSSGVDDFPVTSQLSDSVTS